MIFLKKKGVWTSITCHSHRSGDITMIESHDECGKVVHRPCSSTVQNLIETLLSFPYQLRLDLE